MSGERRGSWVHYRLNPDAAARFGALAEGFVERTGPSGGSAGPIVTMAERTG